MLAFRALQAIGAAGGARRRIRVPALPERARRRLWIAAAVFGAAVGPALGGALTQAFDWRAIFLAQVPLALAAAVACLVAPVEPRGGG